MADNRLTLANPLINPDWQQYTLDWVARRAAIEAAQPRERWWAFLFAVRTRGTVHVDYGAHVRPRAQA